MTAILVAFFSVVIAVNFLMARLASSTFGGTVVDNSYVASQRYNEWLARAAAQDRLGWARSVTLDEGRHVLLSVRKGGVPLNGPHVSAMLRHPLGRAEPRALNFIAAGHGVLRSVETLPPGRWRIDLAVRQGDEEARYQEDVQ